VQTELLLRKGLDITRQVVGEEHLYVLWGMNAFGWLRIEQERYDEAEQLFVKALDIARRTVGEEHPNTLGCMNALGVLYKSRLDKKKQSHCCWKQLKAGASNLETIIRAP
jgi:hypothetical protein